MNIFNADFQDFITALNNNNVDYILLGGYAVILYGYSRNTGDMDIFEIPSPLLFRCTIGESLRYSF